LETKDLYRICGIRSTVTVEELWTDGTLRFLAAENYVLGRAEVQFQLQSNPAGIALMFRSLPTIKAEQILGNSYPTVTVVDCILGFGDTELALSSLAKGLYPQVLRKGDSVRII